MTDDAKIARHFAQKADLLRYIDELLREICKKKQNGNKILYTFTISHMHFCAVFQVAFEEEM